MQVTIRGVKFEGNFAGPEFLEKYETLIPETLEKLEAVNMEESASQGIRKQCSCISDFMDELFGAGASKKLFTDMNIMDCLEAWGDVCQMYQKQVVPEINKKMLQYSPERAQRKV